MSWAHPLTHDVSSKGQTTYLLAVANDKQQIVFFGLSNKFCNRTGKLTVKVLGHYNIIARDDNFRQLSWEISWGSWKLYPDFVEAMVLCIVGVSRTTIGIRVKIPRVRSEIFSEGRHHMILIRIRGQGNRAGRRH